MPSSADRMVISCVTENRADWSVKVRNLVLSVRRLSRDPAPVVVVNVVGGVDKAIWSPLMPYVDEFRAVAPFDVRFPHANKLRMFEHEDLLVDCDVWVALDCDILVARDPSEIFSREAIRSKPEDQTILTPAHWHRIYTEFSIEPPAMDCMMTSSGEVTYPWWNSGVIGIPAGMVSTLRDRWAANIPVVAGLVESGALPANWICDQIGFACALLQTELPFDPLPVTGNFPTCFPVLPAVRVAAPGEAVFIHYHHRLTSQGLLPPSGDEVIDAQLDQFNRGLAQVAGIAHRSLDDLRDDAATAGAWVRAQRWLAKSKWYRSPRLRPLKAAMVNASRRIKGLARRG